MKASLLFKRDQRVRGSNGWLGCFIAPRLPSPRTAIEKRARELIAAHGIDLSKSVTVHVYDLVELVEKALEQSEVHQ